MGTYNLIPQIRLSGNTEQKRSLLQNLGALVFQSF